MNTRLRSVLLTASIVTAAFGAITYTSCTEDKCKAIVCANGGTCKDGACICPSGYEGAQCETVNRERFLGNWNVDEDGTISANAVYPVIIEKGASITEVTLKNFRNYYTANVKARVKGDTLYIDPQDIPAGPGVTNTVEGKAFLTDHLYYGKRGEIKMRYQVRQPGGVVDDYGFDENNPNSKASIWTK
jgi:hypothetical protein